MRVNLGCGPDVRPGYINADIREKVGDFTCDARELPWPDESVQELLAIDLLEHFPSSEIDAILREWRRVLHPKGTLILRVPNLAVLSVLIATEDVNVRLYIRNVYGGHRYGPEGSLDAHHTGWTPRLLAEDLGLAGLVVLDNDLALNMTVKARRG